MTWTTPKTNWDTSPKNPDETDFNRIEGNLDFLKGDIETKKGVIVTALQSIGYSVTMANTHAELAAIISAILEATGDAVVADVAIGKTFSVLGQVGLTGTAKRRATGTAVTQVTDGETSFITVTGLTFKPTIVVTNREGPGNVKAPGMIANGKNYYASQYWDGVNPPTYSIYTETSTTAVGSFTCKVARSDIGTPATGGESVTWWEFE